LFLFHGIQIESELREKKMKRLLSMLAVFVMVLAAGSLAMAQSDPFVGTWKLDVAASKFEPGPPPQSQTRTWDASGNVDVKSVSPSGKTGGYSYTIVTDGKGHPAGDTIPNGSDTLTAKKVSSHLITAKFTKAGKVVESTTYTVSADGKTLMIVAKGVLPNGKTLNNNTRWDKE
jgi:hypothetical protein